MEWLPHALLHIKYESHTFLEQRLQAKFLGVPDSIAGA